jgi:hypothetical protein
MRKETQIEIDGKKITIRELSTDQIIDLLEDGEAIRLLIGVSAGMPSDMKKLIFRSMDLPDEETFNSIFEGSGDYMKVETAFRELHADFLGSLPARIDQIRATAQRETERTLKAFTATMPRRKDAASESASKET